jgi:hypothetical protein
MTPLKQELTQLEHILKENFGSLGFRVERPYMVVA